MVNNWIYRILRFIGNNSFIFVGLNIIFIYMTTALVSRFFKLVGYGLDQNIKNLIIVILVIFELTIISEVYVWLRNKVECQ